jgi:hypothetical protein
MTDTAIKPAVLHWREIGDGYEAEASWLIGGGHRTRRCGRYSIHPEHDRPGTYCVIASPKAWGARPGLATYIASLAEAKAMAEHHNRQHTEASP